MYDYVAGKADWFATGLPGEGESMTVPRIGALAEAPCTCHPAELAGELRERLAGRAWELCAVLNRDGVLLGTLEPAALEGDAAWPVEQAMNPAPSTFRPDVPLEQLRHWFAHHETQRAVPVTTPEGRLLGMVTQLRIDVAVPAASGNGVRM